MTLAWHAFKLVYIKQRGQLRFRFEVDHQRLLLEIVTRFTGSASNSDFARAA